MNELRSQRLGLAVLVAFCVGTLLSLLHLAVEQHAVCPEHQAVHHLESTHELTGAEDEAEQFSDVPSGEDEHCDHTQFRQPLVLKIRTVRTLAAVHARAGILLSVRDTDLSFVAIPVWQVAPKNSPPLV